MQFIQMYGDIVDEVETKLFHYLTAVLTNAESTPTHPLTSAATTQAPAVGEIIPTTFQPAVKEGMGELQIQDGFPLMPEIHGDEKYKKEDYEDLLRWYLTAHYSECGAVMWHLN